MLVLVQNNFFYHSKGLFSNDSLCREVAITIRYLIIIIQEITLQKLQITIKRTGNIIVSICYSFMKTVEMCQRHEYDVH